MQPADRELERALDPLRGVDIQALASIADSLKTSRDSTKRAVGVFLDRINRYRSNVRRSGTSPNTNEPQTTASPLDLTSGLQDLKD